MTSGLVGTLLVLFMDSLGLGCGLGTLGHGGTSFCSLGTTGHGGTSFLDN